MRKLCEDELKNISNYIASDIDFMNFRKTSRDTYNITYERDIQQTRRIYMTNICIIYVIIQSTIILTSTFLADMLWLSIPSLILLFYFTLSDFYVDDDRILRT